MKKDHFLLIIGIIIITAAIILRLTSSEDSWICQNGEWVKHGSPNSPQPTTLCPGAEIFQELKDSVEMEKNTNLEVDTNNNRDEHGCLVSAGYNWCEEKQKCLQAWEETREGLVTISYEDEVSLTNPQSSQIITSPLTVTGQAKGTWFFEAIIPIKLIDLDDNIILTHYGQAESDWMTEEMVPFKAILDFTTTAESGYLVIYKNNPSGLPENDASIKIPIKFK